MIIHLILCLKYRPFLLATISSKFLYCNTTKLKIPNLLLFVKTLTRINVLLRNRKLWYLSIYSADLHSHLKYSILHFKELDKVANAIMEEYVNIDYDINLPTILK